MVDLWLCNRNVTFCSLDLLSPAMILPSQYWYHHWALIFPAVDSTYLRLTSALRIPSVKSNILYVIKNELHYWLYPWGLFLSVQWISKLPCLLGIQLSAHGMCLSGLMPKGCLVVQIGKDIMLHCIQELSPPSRWAHITMSNKWEGFLIVCKCSLCVGIE